MNVLKNKISVAGLHISTYTKQALLEVLEDRSLSGKKTTIVTPYSEFLLLALREGDKEELFNSFDIAIPDGVGIFFAERFLSQPFHTKNYYSKIFEANLQAFVWLTKIILSPKSLYTTIPEKISGADFIWDLAALAERTEQTVYLAGGFEDTPERLSKALQNRFPKLKIAGYSNKSSDDLSLVEEIKASKPDFIFAALGPQKQERWIMKNHELDFKIAIGLGGSFDYAVGDKLNPPGLFRKFGLEWLFRLITQPKRYRRIYEGVVLMVIALVRYKVFMSMPFRKNVVAVIQNTKGQILICKRNPIINRQNGGRDPKGQLVDYWQFPQGGVDNDEDLVSAGRRESQEETALKQLEYLKTSQYTNSYIWRNAWRKLWFNYLKYKGQEQSIVFFKYFGSDQDVVIDNREFVDYKWVELNQLSLYTHEERQSLVKIVIKDLA
jgi:N-acetylglucosaminyldiphosphoundecaprenol N-acetyl-beta-D-mannosaminyltransferase